MIDLHIHSKYSYDSLLSPDKILRVAKKKGLTGIAVTDHNTIKGGFVAEKINRDRDFTIIIGSEINTEIGDIIGLCISEEIQARNSIEVIEEIKDQGGLVILPHPFRGHKLNQFIIEHSDAIEVFNGRSNELQNSQALEFAKKYNKPMIAGSDAHFASEIGNTYMRLNAFSQNSKMNICSNYDVEILHWQESPPYYIDASQIIKTIKSKNYRKSIHYTASFIYHFVKQ